LSVGFFYSIKRVEEPKSVETVAEKEDDLVQKLETIPKAIFSPNNKSAQQQQQQQSSSTLKNNKYRKNLRIWMDTLKLPYYSSSGLKVSNHFGLENIPEEETLLGDKHQQADTVANNKNESSILTNNYALESTLPPPQAGVDIITNEQTCSRSDNGSILKQNDSISSAMEHPLLQKTIDDNDDVDSTEHELVDEAECKYVNKLSDTNHHASSHHAMVPIYKKKHLKRAFDKPGEDKNLIALGMVIFHLLYSIDNVFIESIK